MFIHKTLCCCHCHFLCSVISQGKVVALDRWGGKWNHLSMTYRLTTNCSKNYCNRTLIVKVIVENVVKCFLLGHSVDQTSVTVCGQTTVNVYMKDTQNYGPTTIYEVVGWRCVTTDELIHDVSSKCHPFYPRDAMLARVTVIATCLSVRPSRAGIVSKRRKLASWFLHRLIAPSL